MKIPFYKYWLICLVLLAQAVYAQVPVSINSGNPAFPFPQFLDYGSDRKTLASVNAPGVTHIEMEQTIRDAWQIFANSFKYDGTAHGGVKYIKGNIGCPYDCSEGDGYALLGAAYMADKNTFDGLWFRTHDIRRATKKKYTDCNTIIRPGYKYGENTLAEPGGDAATDGDNDIALALLMAWKQWGDNSGYNDACGNPISYKTEALEVIRGLVERKNSQLDPNRFDCRSVSGNVGFDGYLKKGNTWGELTRWASNDPTWCPEFPGIQDLFADYMAPSYYHAFADFLQTQGGSPEDLAWNINQFKRAEASCDWFSGKLLESSPRAIAHAGKVALDVNNVPTFTAVQPGEDFRFAWRTTMNYMWHGNPSTTWDPVTHQVKNVANSYQLDISKRHSEFLTNPGKAPWSNTCLEVGGGPALTYSGPSQISWQYTPLGAPNGDFPLNWNPASGSPAAVSAQDFALMGKLYRQCAIEWDVTTPGDGYLSSVPVYFHGWFRLLGMLVLSGSNHSPMKLVKESNVKVYHQLDKTYAFTGDQLVYTIKYRNYASVAATGVKVTTTIPAGLEYVSSTGGGTNVGGVVTWNVNNVPGFSTGGGITPTEGQFTMTVKVTPGFSGQICTKFDLTTTNGQGWTSNEYPNNQTAILERNCVDIVEKAMKIDKSVDYKKVNPGQKVTYTVNFENASSGGFINGGRPGVNFAYAHDGTAASASQHAIKIRLYHGAVEPYIDYGNYRISMFVNDNTNNCIFGQNGCTTGWVLDKDIYEGGDATKIKISNEDIVAGSDAKGSWNQRIIVQFANQLTTTTTHVSRYFGMGQRVHLGGTQPLRVKWRLHTNSFGPVKWDDDWSWNANAQDADDGLFLPVTNDFTDIHNPNIPVTIWHNEACEKPTKFVDNILIEEWDGYTWRRIYGNSPVPGRDVNNVVVKDVLPAGFVFGGFVNDAGVNVGNSIAVLGENATYDLATRTITWTKAKLQVKQKGTFKYVAAAGFSSGTCNRADELRTNTASIEGTNETAVTDTANVTVTCTEVILPPPPSSMKKTANKASYLPTENITYTLTYTNTDGSLTTANLNAATNWTSQNGAAMTVAGGQLKNINNDAGVMTYNFSHGTDGTIEASIKFASSAAFGIAFRHTGGAKANGEYIVFKPNPGAGLIEVRAYNGTTPLGSPTTIGFPGDPTTIKLELVGTKVNLWVGNTSNPTPTFTFTGFIAKAGYAGVINGWANDGGDSYGSHTVVGFNSHLDSAFDLEISDPIPSGISFLSSPNGGTNNAGTVKFPISTTPVLANAVITRSWVGTISACPANGKLVNNAYTNILGHTANSIASQVIVNCGSVQPTCVPPTSVTANPATTSACTGQADTLKAAIVLGTNPLTGYRYVWYKSGNAPLPINYTSVYADKIFTSVTAADNGTWILRVEDGTAGLPTCYKEASFNLTVNTPPAVPVTSLTQPTCAIPTGSINVTLPTGTGITYSLDSINFKTAASFTGLAPNTYKVFVKNASGCTSSASVTINAAPGSPAAPATNIIQPTCTVSTGTITVTSPTGAGLTYSINGTDFQAGTIFAGLNSNTYTVTVKNAAECSSASTVTINVAPTKPSSVLSANLTSYCLLPSGITLTASDAGNGVSYEFFKGSVSQGAASTSRTFANATVGSWKVIITNLSGCSDSSARFVISKKPVPVAQITSANPSSYCPSTNGTTLTAFNAGNGATYEWFKGGSSTGLPSANTTLVNATVGSYTVKVSLNGCDSTSGAVSVIQSANLSLNISGDTALCQGEGLTLITDQPSNITWTLPDNSQVTTPFISYPAPLFGIYKAVYLGSGGCTGTDSVLVSVSSNPVATLSPANTSYCAKENGVTLNAGNAGTGALYSWKKDNLLQGAPTSANSLQNAKAGNWKVIVTNSSGCTDSSSTVQITFTPSPAASITTLDPSYCPTANGTSLTAQDAGTNAVYEWIKSPAISGTVSGNIFNNATAGIYTVKVTLNGCDSTSQPIEVKQSASISLVISGDTTLCEGDPLNLSANQTSGISWTLPDKSKVNTPALSLTAPMNGLYKAESTAQGGCNGADSVMVVITPLPAAEILPGQNSYCTGQNGVTLTAKDAGQFAEYEWLKGNTSVGSGISLLNATEGNYTVKVTIGTCSKSSAITTVTQSSALNVSISAPQKVYCQGDPGVTLTANSSALNASYEWFKDGVSVATASPNNVLQNATEGLYKVKVTSGLCSGESDTVGIKASGLILTQLDFDPKTPTDTCLGSVLTINTSGTPGTIEWTENGVSQGIHAAYTFTLSQTTVITANLTTTLSCAIPKTTGPREITIRATPVTTPSVIIDRSQASVKNCEGESTRLFMSSSANAGSNPTFQWYVNGILKTGETDTLGLVLENWTNPTLVELEITKNDGCTAPGQKSVKSAPITLNGNPKVNVNLQILRINDNTTNGFICKGAQVNLEVITNIKNPDISYYWRNNTPLKQFGDPVFNHKVEDDITDTISVAVSGCYTGTISATASRSIKIERPVTVQITNNLNGTYAKTICEGQVNSFQITATGNIKSFNWYKNNLLLPDHTNAPDIGNLAISNEIKVEAVPNVSCGANASDSTLIADVRQNPKPGFLNAEPLNICSGDNITLKPVETNVNYAYTWLKDSVTISTLPDSITVSEPGTYTLIIANGPCIADSFVQVTQTIAFVKASAEPVEFFPGEEVLLKSVTDPNQQPTFQWSPVEIMRSPNDHNTIALPFKSGFVKILVRTAGNCFAVDSIELKKKDRLFIPNAIVPGNNDQNSFWGITGTENYPELDVKVYNRWGSLVHEQTGYSIPWDGTRNGKDLPTGTYYYIIKDRAFEKPFVGDLTIVR